MQMESHMESCSWKTSKYTNYSLVISVTVTCLYSTHYKSCNICRCCIVLFFFLSLSLFPRKEMSAYYLEHASVDHVQKHFDFFEEESRSLLAAGLPIPAYV